MIRTILELSSRNSSRRFSGQIIRQKSCRHPSRKEFSSATPRNASAKPNTAAKPSVSGNSFPKVLIGSIAVGAAAGVAYQTGYLDQFLNKEKPDPLKVIGHDNKRESPVLQDVKPLQNVLEDKVPAITELPKDLNLDTESERRKVESSSTSPSSESTDDQHDIQPQEQAKFEVSKEQDKVLDHEKVSNISLPMNDQSLDSGIPSKVPNADQSADSGLPSEAPTAYQKADSGRSSEESPQTKISDAVSSKQPDEEVKTSQTSSPSNVVAGDSEVKPVSTDSYLAAEDEKEDPHNSAPTLLDAYHLEDKDDEIPSVSAEDHTERERAFVSGIEELDDAVVTKDGKLILDFLQAIHAAEVRQAELDARTFAEEKRAMKEKYEKELKDAIARELMHAEEAALLDKELKRERAKAALAVKSLQQKLEERHKMELEEKEREAELKLNKVDELAKAELSAAIAREKASQIEKMAEANLHINALCMAFYARSEETRQSHSVHKLALGALALEDSLSKGLPIKAEIEALQTYLHGIDKDSILDLVLSSLPEETIAHGTESVLQLSQQFDTIKGTLQHYSLIPPGGGGILAHSFASIASWLKFQKVDPSGEGIESVISRVENYLAEGKLAEAADALEEGSRGSQAADIIHSWVKQVRNRAIAEQALTLLQSYATSVSLTLLPGTELCEVQRRHLPLLTSMEAQECTYKL